MVLDYIDLVLIARDHLDQVLAEHRRRIQEEHLAPEIAVASRGHGT